MNTCLLCEQPDDTGSYLCPGCTKATRVRLELLPALYEGLAPFLTPAAAGSQPRGSKPAHAPLPVAVDILDLRGPGGMVGVVENWVGVIHQARAYSGPVRHSGLSIEARLKSAVAELLNHLPWVAVSWPDAGVFAADIRELTRSVSSIVDPQGLVDRGTRMGACVAQIDGGAACGAVLRLFRGEKAVTCRWCGTVYPPVTWTSLKQWQDEDEKTTANDPQQVVS
ncbi:hypothetical protein ACIRQP_03535 [Streptomyces sp. NPDC102274]|uniref:hypothetical protein n=1 Tax=Streptomyces sp. NPDC102274 TaxID=3366151 RepID=UPI003801FBCD